MEGNQILPDCIANGTAFAGDAPRDLADNMDKKQEEGQVGHSNNTVRPAGPQCLNGLTLMAAEINGFGRPHLPSPRFGDLGGSLIYPSKNSWFWITKYQR